MIDLMPMLLIAILALALTDEKPLRIGDTFPVLSAQTMSDTSLELPRAGAGKTQMILFSFTRAGGLDVRLWNQRLEKDFGSELPFAKHSVVVVESIPKLFRRMAVSGMKSSIPSSLWGKTAVLDRDEAVWKARLAVSDDTRGYLLLLDTTSRVAWMSKGPFTEKEYGELTAAVTSQLTAGK